MKSSVWSRFAAVAFASVAFAQAAHAFELEGAYEITNRDLCESDRIDTVVLYALQDGSLHGTLSSNEFALSYQEHIVTWDGANAVSGYTAAGSSQDATFTATVSDDRATMTGTVDSTACDHPWNFTATRKQLPPAADALQPLAAAPTLATLAGSYDAETDASEGALRIMQMPNGRTVANYGTDLVPRLISFADSVLDTRGGTIELYHYDGFDVQVKWVLKYGTIGGQAALQGYGISRWGRFYPITALKR